MSRHLVFAAKLLVSGGLVYFLYRNTPMQQMSALLHGIKPVYFGAIGLLLIVNTLISAKKWQLFLRADGIVLTLSALTGSYMAGTFCNLFLPSNIGGDSFRIYDIAKRGTSAARSAASVFADRFSGFIALVSLSLLASLAIAGQLASLRLVVLPVVLFVVFLCVLGLIINPTMCTWLLQTTRLNKIRSVDRIAAKLMASFNCYWSDKPLLIRVISLSFLFQFLVILVVYLLGCSLGTTVPFIYFGAFVPMITLMEALPISIYGIGVRDYGYVFFFTQVGMGDIESRTLALLFMAVSVCYSLCGGISFFVRLWRRQKST